MSAPPRAAAGRRSGSADAFDSVYADAVPIERDSAAGSPPAFGSVDDDEAWIPFFGYNAMNDVADIRLTARVPAAYRLSTTLPQTETVAGGVRVGTARSEEPGSTARTRGRRGLLPCPHGSNTMLQHVTPPSALASSEASTVSTAAPCRWSRSSVRGNAAG